MSNETFFENNSNSDQPTAQIGSQLKQAREKLDLTIVDVARQLRLKPERIDELERDDYHGMPGITFIKGYLRAYAQLVNLPADNLIALFEQLKPSSKMRTVPLVAKLHTQEKPIRWGLYLMGLAFVVLMAIWWNSFSGGDANANANAGMPRQPLPNEPATPPLPASNTLPAPQAPAPQVQQAPTVHTDMAHAGGMISNNHPTNTPEKTSDTASASAPPSDSQNATASENSESTSTSKKVSKKLKHKKFAAQDENMVDTIDNDMPPRSADTFE